MRIAKCLGLAIILAVLIPVTQSMSRWSEDRGVFDDVCYLRQAHLFERFGTGGLDTDIRLDDDGYFRKKTNAIGLSEDNPSAIDLFQQLRKRSCSIRPVLALRSRYFRLKRR